MGIHCPKCRTYNGSYSTTCTKCGTRLVSNERNNSTKSDDNYSAATSYATALAYSSYSSDSSCSSSSSSSSSSCSSD